MLPEVFERFGRVSARRMFGLASGERLYLKTDEENRAQAGDHASIVAKVDSQLHSDRIGTDGEGAQGHAPEAVAVQGRPRCRRPLESAGNRRSQTRNRLHEIYTEKPYFGSPVLWDGTAWISSDPKSRRLEKHHVSTSRSRGA